MKRDIFFTHCANCGEDLTDGAGDPVCIASTVCDSRCAGAYGNIAEPHCPECGSPDIIEFTGEEGYEDTHSYVRNASSCVGGELE